MSPFAIEYVKMYFKCMLECMFAKVSNIGEEAVSKDVSSHNEGEHPLAWYHTWSAIVKVLAHNFYFHACLFQTFCIFMGNNINLCTMTKQCKGL